MGRRLYVDGNIVIMTPYFICPDMGAGFGIPKDAEVIKTNDIIEGSPCLVIDEDRPQSLFNEYYATGEVASGYISVSYLHNTYTDCFDEFNIEIVNPNSEIVTDKRIMGWCNGELEGKSKE